jgi:hypothetical protein
MRDTRQPAAISNPVKPPLRPSPHTPGDPAIRLPLAVGMDTAVASQRADSHELSLPESRSQTTRLDAFRKHSVLRLSEHAFWMVSSHGPGGGDSSVCAACEKPWRCPDVVWAGQWITYAIWSGLLEQAGVQLSNDVVAILAPWADVYGYCSQEKADG